MNQETKALEDYQNNKVIKNVEGTMWIGIFIMCGVIAVDFVLFNWIAHILK